jgi:type I restriction enzyme M protein
MPSRDIDSLQRYWDVLPSVRAMLFESAGRPGYFKLKMPASEVKAAIFAHPEFTSFNASVTKLFMKWRTANEPKLRGIKLNDHPKALIGTLSEELLETFQKARLIDPYDVYQHLMDYWAETMQDDVYMIVSDGWKALLEGKPNTGLIPETLIVAKYFAKEQSAIEKLEAGRDDITRQMEELDEEHGGEEGLLADTKTDKGKLTKISVKAQLAKLGKKKESADERSMLEQVMALIEQEAEAGKKVKEAQKALDALVSAKYAKLAQDEVKALVVDDKWLAALETAVQSELDRVSQALTSRIKQLAERYAQPLPQIIKKVDVLASKVDGHLKKMGYKS